MATANKEKGVLHMKIEAELKERLQGEADADGRSLSNLVEKILKDFVRDLDLALAAQAAQG